MQELLKRCNNADLLMQVAEGKEVVWINENLEKTDDAMAKIDITMAHISPICRKNWKKTMQLPSPVKCI